MSLPHVTIKDPAESIRLDRAYLNESYWMSFPEKKTQILYCKCWFSMHKRQEIAPYFGLIGEFLS
jgi:hypothetical protein